MSYLVRWIAPEANSDAAKNSLRMAMRPQAEKKSKSGGGNEVRQPLPGHNFPAPMKGRAGLGIIAGHDWQSDPDIWL